MADLIRFDWAIKKILRSKANFNILEGFLSCVLSQSIKIEEILESESNQEYAQDKMNRVDMLVRNEHGELILIEIQNAREYDFVSRMLYGSAKIITENIQLGQRYSKIKKVYCVSVVYFNLGQGKDYIYHGKTHFTGVHVKDELQLNANESKIYPGKQSVSQIYPEYYIIRVDHYHQVAKTSLDEWIHFLKTEKVETDFNAPGLKEAAEVLNVLKLSPEERAAYKRYLEDLSLEASTLVLEKKLGEKIGLEKGQKIGIKIGLEKGEKIGIEKGEKIVLEKGKKIGVENNKKVIAQEMLARGIAEDLVAECTGLTLQEISELS